MSRLLRSAIAHPVPLNTFAVALVVAGNAAANSAGPATTTASWQPVLRHLGLISTRASPREGHHFLDLAGLADFFGVDHAVRDVFAHFRGAGHRSGLSSS